MNLTEFAKEVHENVVSKGWWEGERNKAEMLALVGCEIREAETAYGMDDHLPQYDGSEVEICDAVIRLLDFMAGFDIAVTAKEPECKRFFDAPVLYSQIFDLIENLRTGIMDAVDYNYLLQDMLQMIEWDKFCEIAKAKHEYNKSRSYKHGNKRF